MPIEFLLLKNWVGQINSTIELKRTNLIKEYNIKTTKTSSKILYMYTSSLPENNSSNILKYTPPTGSPTSTLCQLHSNHY